MLTKFETKSNRVKGCAFHPKRPWILASLHTGMIQLWDYRMGTLIDRFDEHEGPVRSVDFHGTQPLFVSGGDDYKVKVWNYQQRRCIFTLVGHLDYIRTVQFHHESPWVLSCSDDQTIRIWNWQSRACIAVLTGHNHYVMCARFHPKEDIVASASLDQTIRVWDVSALRRKSPTPGGHASEDRPFPGLPSMGADLFGSSEAMVKYVLEGHERGVNWVHFHPSLPLLVSGADDRQVKLWRMNESKAWEVDTLRGHTNNVSCVMFHAKQDLIVSNSEDRTVRVWDMSKRTGVQTFRREHDRFWILAAHPEINLLAAGHDSGIIVFKLERERPAHSLHGSKLFYVKDRYLRLYDLASRRSTPLLALKRPSGSTLNAAPRHLGYNPAENAVLLTSTAEGGSYELYVIPRDAGTKGEASVEARRGTGSGAAFVARNRFAVLDRTQNALLIKNLLNEVTKKVAVPAGLAPDSIFYAGTGAVLLRGEDRVAMLDLQTRAVVGEVAAAQVKYVVWSPDMSLVALLSKHAVVIADRKLKSSVTVHETIRVKSAAFDASGALLYTTLNHMKYCLPNGDSGIVRTLDAPLYLVSVQGGQVTALDREGRVLHLTVNASEFAFKLHLMRKEYPQVLAMIQSGALVGDAMVAYLQAKGFPEVAMHMVKDPRRRFTLALGSGNVEAALEAAQEMDDAATWRELGQQALRLGHLQVVEYACQKTKDYDRLAFLYVLTGERGKLEKMRKMAELRNDPLSRFHCACYLGDAMDRVRVLREAGQLQLAYLTAHTHGMGDEEAVLAQELRAEGGKGVDGGEGAGGDVRLPRGVEGAALLWPPAPVKADGAPWPSAAAKRGMFDQVPGSRPVNAGVVMEGPGEGADAWGGEEDLDTGTGTGTGTGVAASDTTASRGGDAGAGMGEVERALEGGAWGDDDLDLGALDLGGHEADDTQALPTAAMAAQAFIPPAPGVPHSRRWGQTARTPCEHVAANDPASAMRVLHRQCGVSHFAPYKQLFLDVVAASHAVAATLPGLPPFALAIDRDWSDAAETQPPAGPRPAYSLTAIVARIAEAQGMVTAGRFTDALRAFNGCLLACTMLAAKDAGEMAEIHDAMRTCRDYVVAMRVELKRKEVSDKDPKRSAELSCYFTHCGMAPVHEALSLRAAMTVLFKMKCYGTASHMARRLVDLGPGDKFAVQAKQVLLACDKAGLKDDIELDYDPRTPFDVCCLTYTPIYRGAPFVQCPLSGAKFQPSCKGQPSPVGGVARIGAEATGLDLIVHGA